MAIRRMNRKLVATLVGGSFSLIVCLGLGLDLKVKAISASLESVVQFTSKQSEP